MDKLYNNFLIQQPNIIKKQNAPNIKNGASDKNGSEFEQLLNEVTNTNVQFSKHANMRLSNRDISLSNEQIKRLENGIDNAKQKGINDSLVLVDNIALVVNVDSRTVITALNKDQKNIFTNIDGAVIV